MTGQELLEALSFVDARYIAEAETAPISKIPWVKYISVAACLCILLLGAYGMRNLAGSDKLSAADAPEAAAPPAAMVPEAVPEAAAPPLMDDAVTEAAPAESEIISGELHHVGFAHLRILEILEEGHYRAYVVRVPDEPGPIDAGTEMTLVIDPEMIPGQTAEIRNDLSQVTEDMLVMIENGAYDAGSNTLYAEILFMAPQE